AAVGAAIFVLNRSAFDGFFMSEDFNYLSLYFHANGDFLRAVFGAMGATSQFFRPASISWVIGTQLLLPLDPLVQHLRNFLFVLINVFLVFQILFQLTVSRAARWSGTAFFALSGYQLMAIGYINIFEDIVTMLHFLAPLLFLVRYLQKQRWLDLGLSVGFFTLGVFSRDTGVLYTVVVVALIAAFTLKDNRHAWKTVILRSLPYCLVAVIYVAVRLLIVGLPKT